MIKTTNEKINDFFLECIQNKTPYRDYSSGTRHRVKTSGLTIVSGEGEFPTHELWFIRRVKEDIIKYNLHKNKNVSDRKFKSDDIKKEIKYYKVGNIKPGTKYKDCVEIDLSAAYWETANKLGLIRPEIYDRTKPMSWEEAKKRKIITDKQFSLCKNMAPSLAKAKELISDVEFEKLGGISKKSRLAAIGSLAKRTTVTYFTGERWYTLYDDRDSMYFLWNAICLYVSKLMQRAAKLVGDDFILFWTDAIILKKGSEQKIIDLFKSEGYYYKVFSIDKVVVNNEEAVVYSSDAGKKAERIFTLDSKYRRKSKKRHK